MKYYTALCFRTALSLDELAKVIELNEPFFDCENEDEWVIGVCEGVDMIDVCRSHTVPPIETDTVILRFAHAMDSVIPKEVLITIANRLMANGISEIDVRGFNKWGDGFISSSFIAEFGR